MKPSHKSTYEVTVESDHDHPVDDKWCVGYCLRETWRRDGLIDRLHGGPAVTIMHPVTYAPVREEYYEDGVLHRIGGPAIIYYAPESGDVVRARFIEDGKEILNHDPDPDDPWPSPEP